MDLRVLASVVVVAACAPQAPRAAAEGPRLSIPIACEVGRTCEVQHYVDRDPSPASSDYQCGSLTYDTHDGTDFRVPTMAAQKAGVDVVAAADGKVLRVRDGVEDVSMSGRGRESVANTECGNGAVVDHGNGWEAQYCHMAKGSLAVKPGDRRHGLPPGEDGRAGLGALEQFDGALDIAQARVLLGGEGHQFAVVRPQRHGAGEDQ